MNRYLKVHYQQSNSPREACEGNNRIYSPPNSSRRTKRRENLKRAAKENLSTTPGKRRADETSGRAPKNAALTEAKTVSFNNADANGIPLDLTFKRLEALENNFVPVTMPDKIYLSNGMNRKQP